MKIPPLSMLVPVLAFSPCAQALAGLSEATDFGGAWTSGSVAYTGGGSSPNYWEDQSTTTIDTVDAAVGRLDGSYAVESWMQTTVAGPTTLYFSYRADDFSGAYDGSFSVILNGEPPVSLVSFGGVNISSHGWKEQALDIPAGERTVRWQIAYNRGATSGRAYVDQVWTSGDARPRITDTADRTAQFGAAFSWQVPVNSATPTTLAVTGLPPGLAVDAQTHVIHGTPTTAGTFPATLTAVNGSGQHIAHVIFAVEPGTTTIAEGLDAAALVFTQHGSANAWGGVTGFGHDGMDSVRGLASNDASTFLSTDVNGPGTLTFWYRGETWTADPPLNNSTIRLSVGKPPPSDPLSLDWTPFQSTGGPDWYKGTAPIPAGPQSIYWRAWAYADPADQRSAYLDEVTFVPASVPPQSTFAAWQTAWNVVGQPLDTDIDGDGLTLPMEYAFGGSPYVFNPELLPVASISGGYFTLQVTKAPSPTDLTYLVQGSKELTANSWVTSTVEVLDEDASHILARSKKMVSEEPAGFLRVKVLVDP